MGGWPHERTETTVPGVPGEGRALKLGLCFPVWSMSWLEGLKVVVSLGVLWASPGR